MLVFFGLNDVSLPSRQNRLGRGPNQGSLGGIWVSGLPGAYKDVAAVVDATEKAGLAKKIARLEPLLCVKG